MQSTVSPKTYSKPILRRCQSLAMVSAQQQTKSLSGLIFQSGS